jgi:hypothetical protein
MMARLIYGYDTRSFSQAAQALTQAQTTDGALSRDIVAQLSA